MKRCLSLARVLLKLSQTVQTPCRIYQHSKKNEKPPQPQYHQVFHVMESMSTRRLIFSPDHSPVIVNPDIGEAKPDLAGDHILEIQECTFCTG